MACFAVSAASYVPFIGVAPWLLPRRMASPEVASAPRGERATGIGGILREPQLRAGLLTLLATGTLCSPLVTFTPVLVKDAFHGGAGQFSMAAMAFGAGGVLGAVGLLSVGPTVDRRRISSSFAVGGGAVLVLAGLTPWFSLVLPLFVLAGVSITVSNTAVNALLQSTTSPRRLGHIVSLYMLAMRGGIALGALLTGLLVSLMGVRYALLLNGLLAIAAQSVIARTWLRAPTRAKG